MTPISTSKVHVLSKRFASIVEYIKDQLPCEFSNMKGELTEMTWEEFINACFGHNRNTV